MQRAKTFLLVVAFAGLVVVNIFLWPAVLADAGTPKLSVAFLDVGQGDAIFIEAPNGNQVLVDGGKNKAVLRGLGRHMGFFDRFIDAVIATHPDADHIGGLSGVLKRHESGLLLTSGAETNEPAQERFRRLATEKALPRKQAKEGMVIDLGSGVVFEILAPAASAQTAEMELNEASVIGKLTYGETSFLLTGDAPKSIEKYLAFRYGERLEADVLKAGHHGSDTSSSEVFLSAVDPERTVISAGANNNYGHPDPAVLARIKDGGSKVSQTAKSGDIVFESNGQKVTLLE